MELNFLKESRIVNILNVFPIKFMLNDHIQISYEHSQPKLTYYRLPLSGLQNRKVNFFRPFFQ